MADLPDVDAAGPVLSLTCGASSLVCNGVLNSRTRPLLLEAARALFESHPPHVTIDISDVHIQDVDGANSCALVQRMARQTGTTLHWAGLDSDRLRGILPLRARAKRSRPSPARAHLSGEPRPFAQLPPIA